MEKKGFTLIELLAVIVILAIIALIATPTILGVIEKTRKSAFKSSVYGIMDAGQLYLAKNINTPFVDDKIIFTCDGNKCANENGESLDIKGEIPKSGQLIVTSKGKIDAYYLKNEKYCALGERTNLDIQTDCTKLDITDAEVELVVASIKSNSAVINISAKDAESGIKSIIYYLNGEKIKEATFELLGMIEETFIYEELKNNTEYVLKVEIINGNNKTVTREEKITTLDFNNPIITITDTPEEAINGYVKNSIATIEFNTSNIENHEYFIKTTRTGTSSETTIESCENDELGNPTNCSTETVTKLEANKWYKVSGDISVTYSESANETATLYAMVYDGTNYSGATTSTINKIDKEGPELLNVYSGSENFTDYNFSSGENGIAVYNQSFNGSVTITRTSMITPVGNYALKIVTNGTASPGTGGIYQGVYSSPDVLYVVRILAKIPVGYNINYASNATGDNREFTWLTSQEGTGDWKEYIYTLKAGSTGTFGTFGHAYLSPETGYSSTSVTWYIASAQIFTSALSTNMVLMNFDDNSALSAYGCSTSNTVEPTYINIDKSIKSQICQFTAPGTYYVWLKDVFDNVKVYKLGTIYSGTPIFNDPYFESGLNSIIAYNNYSNESVKVTRGSLKTSVGPYALTVVKSSDIAHPGLGGFYQGVYATANNIYIHKMILKVPVGYSVDRAANKIGDGANAYWLTSQEGTGRWEEYAYYTKAGSSGTFSSFGHVYLISDDGANKAVTWYVGYSQIINITSTGSNYVFIPN